MLLAPFLSIGQAETMMKLDHHAYKTSLMNKNERDRLGFECQFLFQYLTTNEGRLLAHLDVRTPHGIKLYWMEQVYASHMEQVFHMRTLLRKRTKNQSRESTDGEVKFLKEKKNKQTREIAGLYHEAIKNYLKARVHYFKVCVLNKIKQPRKPIKVQQIEPSSENKKRSPKLQQDKMIGPQEKREAPRIGPRTQPSVPKTRGNNHERRGRYKYETDWSIS